MSRVCKTAFLLVALVRSYGQLNPVNSSAVHVAAWNTISERINSISVVVSSLDGRERYTGDGRDVEVYVPPGEYLLRVRSPGFEAKSQMLKVYQPSVFRSVVLHVARMHGQNEEGLTGTIRNLPGETRSLRIRLTGLYGDEVWEAIPDARGSFKFPCDDGPYLLLVIADFEKGIAILDSEQVNIHFGQEKNIVIDLKGKSAPSSRPSSR